MKAITALKNLLSNAFAVLCIAIQHDLTHVTGSVWEDCQHPERRKSINYINIINHSIITLRYAFSYVDDKNSPS